MPSPFDVLGIEPDADDDEVTQAYRDRVKEAHPDQGGSVDEFRTVRTAYEQIKAGCVPDDGEPAVAENDGDDPTYIAESRVRYLNYEVLSDHGWGIDDDRLMEKASAADLDSSDYGEFTVRPGESLLEAAENRGFAWPFACRGGACVNCAVLLLDGELSMPVNHVLPSELMERNIRLSCNGMPITDELDVVYNVKHLPALEELLLPPRPFEQAYATD